MLHRTREQLDESLDEIRRSPKLAGTVELIARRPAVGEREIVEHARITAEHGLVGDSWHTRKNRKTGTPNPDQQLTLMNARAIAAITPERTEWPKAGDQLYVDLDLGGDNVPPGTRLAIGTAIVVVTAEPHLGCAKFTKQLGADATKWTNSPFGRALNLRGINARVVVDGEVRTGDAIRKL
ncbi:MAG: MOSC domain-containing protein [Deltaproteobacteria bacterium]|nr:MOSC domain-containing protein [Deltaproteobacteria bacterium]MDQ3297974.1 MOSC domain-containing protein [Myxococcota bacterium]